jgi:hypothetical protein
MDAGMKVLTLENEGKIMIQNVKNSTQQHSVRSQKMGVLDFYVCERRLVNIAQKVAYKQGRSLPMGQPGQSERLAPPPPRPVHKNL